jgi:hypothetical protein
MNADRLLVAGILSILLAATAACSQQGSGPAYAEEEKGGPAPSVAAPSVDEALAREAGQMRIVYRVGPIDLPAGTSAAAMLEKPLAMRFQTDQAIWVTGFRPRVVDANGAELPAELLHQAIVSNLHEENPLCAGTPNPFAVASGMLTEVELPQGHGYPILPTDPIEAKVVFANPTDSDYVDVSFEITLVAKPMNDFASIKDVKPMLVELEPCTHAPMQVEPRAFAQKSATYPVPITGALVVAQGVLQDYGAAIQLTAGTEVMPFWRAEGVQDEMHRLSALTDNPFTDPEGRSFKAGDPLTLGVAYDNTSEAWLAGAGAAAMVYLAPAD